MHLGGTEGQATNPQRQTPKQSYFKTSPASDSHALMVLMGEEVERRPAMLVNDS